LAPIQPTDVTSGDIILQFISDSLLAIGTMILSAGIRFIIGTGADLPGIILVITTPTIILTTIIRIIIGVTVTVTISINIETEQETITALGIILVYETVTLQEVA